MKIYTAKKMVLTIFTALLAGGTINATAATLNDAEINIETNVVTISGNVEKAGKDTLLIVLNPGAEFSDDLDKEALQHQRYIMVDENGDFTYSFKLKLDGFNDSGDYSYYIGGKNLSEILQSKFYFASKEDAMKVVEEIKDALVGKTEAEGINIIKTVLDDESNAKKLAINSFVPFSKGDKSEIARIVYKIMSDENEIDNIKMQEIIKEASVVSAYNKGQDELVISADGEFLYDEILEFSKLDEKYDIDSVECYDEILSDDGRKIVKTSIFNNSYNNAEELGKAYATQILLTGLTNAEKKGFEHVKILLNDKNIAFLGLTIKNKLTDDNLIEIAKQKEYKTVEELQKKIDSLKKSESKPQGGGGGGKNSGAISGGLGSFVVDKTDYVDKKEENKEESKVEKKFVDLSGYSWAEEAVYELTKKGIVNGVSENEFNPAGVLTREQAVKMLCVAIGLNANDIDEEFKDVDKNQWYAPFITAAKKKGFVKGISESEFGIGRKITRQDFAVMIIRAFEIEIEESDRLPADYEEVSDYAKDAVKTLVKKGVITGYSDGSFKPGKECNRAEAAVIIKRVLGGNV